MEMSVYKKLGGVLYESLQAGVPVDPLTEQYPDMSIEDAYAVQQHMMARRLDSGECIVGWKIGVTSTAVMNMLSVYQPDFGCLTDKMVFNQCEPIPADNLIQPKAEGEIAFVLKHDLQGPGVTVADVLAATEGVMTCFEIVDSRIKDWRITIQDTIADNASCGALVLGDRLVNPRNVDLNTCGMVLEKNGEIVATGAGAAALGGPANAVAWLANTLGRMGITMKAGEIVLSGSLAIMVPVVEGDQLRVTIGGIGSCSVRFS